MDTTSHALWSYLIWHNAQGVVLAIFFGIMPDVVSHTPRIFRNAVLGRWRNLQKQDDMPAWMNTWEKITFRSTHSLLLSVTVSTLALIFFGGVWWILAWPLHVLVDVPTHKKRFATPFLWPVSSYHIDGFHWQRKAFMTGNFILLGLAYSILFFM